MNSRFKFRAWDGKGMILPPSPVSSNLGSTWSFDGRTYIEGVFQDWIYMQCTGLKDVNGNDIYEGDLLGGIYEDCWIGYCDKCKALELLSVFDDTPWCMACEGEVHWYELVEYDCKLEVIGNIYDK